MPNKLGWIIILTPWNLFLALVLYWLSSCAPNPCLPQQTTVYHVEQPERCSPEYTMKQNLF